MPELPEAETLARGLAPVLPGCTIRRTRVIHADILRIPQRRFRSELAGRTITEVGRRAKNIVLSLDYGDAFLVVNLGMTGGLVPLGFPELRPPRPTHPAVRFALGDGRALVYDDIRRFGCLEVFDRAGWAARSASIGPEPLGPDFTPERLTRDLARSRTPLRNWLLDQRKVAGVGNIYASEACFLAGVRPLRPANRVTESEATLLHAGIQEVLASSIRHGGTTLRDYRNAGGEPGENQRRLNVYGREADPCPQCRTPVERVVLSNRSAFYCPSCQT